MRSQQDSFDDEAQTVVSELEFGDRTELDPSFGRRGPRSIPANAYTAVMPTDLDEKPRRPIGKMACAPIGKIPCAPTVKALRPLPLRKPLPRQAMIPTQVFGPVTRAQRVRVLPPPAMPSYGWIDAFLGLFRRSR